MAGGTWYNTSICKKLYGNVFEGFIRNKITDRYNIVWSFDAHGKENPSSCDYGSSVGGCPIPSNSTSEALVFLGGTIGFIGCWMKALEHYVLERCNVYVFNMNKLCPEILFELPKQSSPKEKRKSLLHAIGDDWYVYKLGQNLPPLKKDIKQKIPKIVGWYK